MAVETASMDAFEMLTLASEFPEPFTWHFEGRCVVEHGAISREHGISATWSGLGDAMCDDADRAIWNTGMGGQYGVREPTIALRAIDGSWAVPHAHAQTSDIHTRRTQLLWWEMQQRATTAPIAATVLLLVDAPRAIYPHRLPVVKGVPGRSTGENGLRSRLFGRGALLRPTTIGDQEFLTVAYEGAPFDETRSASILTVLSLAFGSDVEMFAEISVDAGGAMVERRMLSRRECCKKDPKPSLNCVQVATTIALGTSLEAMAENARRLRFEQDAPIDAAVITLLACNGRRRDFELRDIVLALDTVSESPAYTPDEGRIVTSERYKPTKALMMAAIEALPEDLPSELRASLCGHVARANRTSSNQRRKRFWRAIGIEPTRKEFQTIELRDDVSHKGFVDPKNAAEELALFEDVRRARTLVNESFLKLLGYEGPIADYLAGVSRPIRGQGATGEISGGSGTESTCSA